MATRHGTAEVSLPSDREILITRHFEAPLPLVWEALTQPRHLLRWWGPDWCPMVKCDVDLRVGGSWRYVCRDQDGNEMGWHGTYRAIEPWRRIVSSEVFEGFPDAESENTMTLTAAGGVTTLQTRVLHVNQEFRDGHVNSGMEGGMQVTFNRLEDLLGSLGSTAERFRRVAARFTDRVEEVADDAWSNPAPCDGWVARDVVRHMVEWMPSFLERASITLPAGPSVDEDPVGAWTTLADGLQALVDDPDVAAQEFEMPPIGRLTVETAIGQFFLGDVLIHTWDLARATGLDETLDADLAGEMLVGMLPLDDMLRQSGHYGPKVHVPDDADDQTKLIAFTGRHRDCDDRVMLDHLSIQCADVAASAVFYDHVLAPIGGSRVMDFGTVIGFGVPPKPDFWLGPLATGEGFRESHIAFTAPDRAAVRAFFEAAKAAGAEVLHEPRLWPEYHPTYYGAFVRDPDGHNVEAVCHRPE